MLVDPRLKVALLLVVLVVKTAGGLLHKLIDPCLIGLDGFGSLRQLSLQSGLVLGDLRFMLSKLILGHQLLLGG